MTAPLFVLTHRQQGRARGYFVELLARVWQARGQPVVFHQGPQPAPPEATALLHVDLTRLPQDYLEWSRRFRACIGSAPADISKRAISQALVDRDDDYDGAVMVKTDLNALGKPERLLAAASGAPLRRLGLKLLERLPPVLGGPLGPRYLSFDRKSAVPAWVWRRRDLVVERFLPERVGSGFAVHQWYFLGPCERVLSMVSDDPIVKIELATEAVLHSGGIPEVVRRRRAELGFDYGKIDYVLSEEGPVVLDANRTPWCGAEPWSPRALAIAQALAPGLQAWVGR